MQNFMKSEFFRGRRKIFRSYMQEDSVAIFFSAPPQKRTNDLYYRYRQDSDFYYLSGLYEMLTSIVVLDRDREYFYFKKASEAEKIWEGRDIKSPEIEKYLGFQQGEIQEISHEEDFFKIVPKILKNKNLLYYDYAKVQRRDLKILEIFKDLETLSREKSNTYCSLKSPREILQKMRLIKTEEEINLLEKSSEITNFAFEEILQNKKEGLFEYEIEAMLTNKFRENNAHEAYIPIVASGKNACILHYTRNNNKLRKGEMLLIDAGAELGLMNTDVSRTMPVTKKFNPAQKDAYKIVLDAQEAAIASCKKNSTLEKVHETALLCLIQGLLDLKILKDKYILEQILTKEKNNKTTANSYKKYYMHKTSHWLGFDVHDTGPYLENGKSILLKENMVCTVEPGLYFPNEDENNPIKELRGSGIRIEDDILITKKSNKNLTENIIKDIDKIEEI